MDLRLVRSFIAIAEELHFRRASERLHMTQPGISQHLRQLEEELGVSLVRRDRRNVSLTRAGEAFLEEARKLLLHVEAAVQLTRRTDRGEVGRLVLGATQPALFIAVPELLRAYKDAAPEMGVVLREMTTAEQEAALRAGEIDAGVLHPPLDDATLACRLICTLPFDVVLSDRHHLAVRPTVSLRDLEGEPLILFPRRIAPQLYDAVITLCHRARFRPDIAIETSPAQAIISYAAAEYGIGFVASETQHTPRPGVVYRRLTGTAPEMTIGIGAHPAESSSAVRTFLDIAVAVGATLR